MNLHWDGTITAVEAESPATSAFGSWEQNRRVVRGTFYFFQFDKDGHRHRANGKVTFEGEIEESGHGELDFQIELFPPGAELQDPGTPVSAGSGVIVVDRITP